MHFGGGVEFLHRLPDSTTSLHDGIEKLEIEERPTSMPAGPAHGRLDRGPHHLYDAIAEASNEVMKSRGGRRLLIVLTDGFEQDSRTTQKAALDAAERADATIYCIDVVDQVLEMVPGLNAPGRAILAKLSDRTGGQLFVAKHAPEAPEAFHQIAEEIRSQYFIGYSPSNIRHDGSFRKIQALIPNRNYMVRARPGYYAPRN